MRWAHLPNAGGLYDQDPLLLDRFRYIFSVRAEYEEKKQKEQERRQRTRSKR